MTSIIEAIKQRESIRTYTEDKVPQELIERIENFIKQNKAPFGINARIVLINTDTQEKPIKLGTYGFIAGASDYMALIYEEMPFAEEGSAYLFEQVILFCTQLGLGTCWLGGSFNRGDFKKQVDLKPNEKLRIVSPIGFKSEKKRFLESLIKPESRKNNSRKPFGSLFFHNDFSTPLTEKIAGIYAEPLEMVRLGPSANNKQSWRIVLNNNVLHFFETSSYGFSAIDMGIAQLCSEYQ